MAQERAIAPDLERETDLPVGAQLAWRLRVLIASGRLPAGARLPSVRNLARGAAVNVNTARSVYARLERDGMLASHHGRGTFVAPGTRAIPELETLAADVAHAARAQGVEPRDLARALYCASWPEGSATPEGLEVELPVLEGDDLPDAGHDEAPARRELRRQIGRPEAHLASYPDEAGGAGTAAHPLLRPRGHVAGAEELEATRDELLERLRDARARAERRGTQQSAARARRDSMIRDPGAHAWDAVSSEEIGDPGGATWEVTPRWGPVGALMNWWRVRVSP
jgi:DNA-binding transcriptional regulator YhcF (GntR family)